MITTGPIIPNRLLHRVALLIAHRLGSNRSRDTCSPAPGRDDPSPSDVRADGKAHSASSSDSCTQPSQE